VQVSEHWQVYSYTFGEGQRAIIRFDHDAATERAHHGHTRCRRVIIFLPLEQIAPNGLPRRYEMLESVEKWEDSLLEALTAAGVDGRLVGVMTYHGLRDIVFQVTDADHFALVVEHFKATLPGVRIETKGSEGWEFFDTRVAPSPDNWRRINDRITVEHLLEAGTDPTQPHALEHHFLGPPERLKFLAEQLSGAGFTGTHAGGDQLTMTKVAPLDPEVISEETVKLAGYCAKIGVRYDGWGALVIPKSK
jgi:regulator of RNase E activity RraB